MTIPLGKVGIPAGDEAGELVRCQRAELETCWDGVGIDQCDETNNDDVCGSQVNDDGHGFESGNEGGGPHPVRLKGLGSFESLVAQKSSMLVA